ncbi:hypothetical protein ES702_04895 [subsurface metagenome]
MDKKEEKIDFEKMLEDLKNNSKESEKNPILEKLREARKKYKEDGKKAKEFFEGLAKKHKTKNQTSWEEIVKRYKKEDE